MALYRHLLLLGLPPAEAQGATHAAFTALYRTLRGGDSVDNWRVWIYRAAHNLKPSAVLSLQTGSRLVHAVTGLPPQQRECIQLCAAGFGYREIASITGLKHSAVGESLRRAIVQLRKAGL